jgi:phosphohistidine phosphatase
MRRLMLLRHAKSDWSRPGLSDHDRPLNPRGREAAPKVGAYMAHHALLPDLIIASTAARVRETLDLALAAFKRAPKVKSDARLYEAGAGALLKVLQATPSDVQSLLLVGHNPGLAELATLLVATGKTEARARLADKFPTGALAVIDVPLDDWGQLHPGSGRLDRFVVPRALKAETD